MAEFVLLLPMIVMIVLRLLTVSLSKRKNEQANIYALLQQAVSLYSGGKYAEAFEIARQFADTDMSTLCGMCTFYGYGCNQDYYKAFHYFETAMKTNTEALAYFGGMLVKGQGCIQDLEGGKRYLAAVAKQGNQYANQFLDSID